MVDLTAGGPIFKGLFGAAGGAITLCQARLPVRVPDGPFTSNPYCMENGCGANRWR